MGMAADIGTLSRFPKIVGNQSAVRELAFTGRTFDAKEAKELGFVSKVVDGGMEEVLSKLDYVWLKLSCLLIDLSSRDCSRGTHNFYQISNRNNGLETSSQPCSRQ